MNNISAQRQIIENIHEELITSELSDSIGLHSGTSGVALFMAYYNRIIRCTNEISPRIMEILEHNIECINAGYQEHTINNGISGFGWLCEHLRKMDMLNREDIKFLDNLDPFLYNKMIFDIQQGNYDYLHGALGVGTYFISRFDKIDVHGYLEDLLTELEKSGVECENGTVKWISVLNYETGEKGYNISLSHGTTSIAAFLIRLYQLNFETDRVNRLLIRTMMYILDQITYTEGSISYFPSYAKESSSGKYYSRLGWCYGDLGIAHILLQVAVVIKNEKWRTIALQILLHTSNRRNLQENMIMDAGICHGSAGIAYVFWNLYKNTGVQAFCETTDYWLEHTVKMAKYTDGLAGFKTWSPKNIGQYIKSDTLLEGISGIGLVLLSHLKSNEITWDESLMLSLENLIK
jgi:lantibiotic modifying enzyme